MQLGITSTPITPSIRHVRNNTPIGSCKMDHQRWWVDRWGEGGTNTTYRIYYTTHTRRLRGEIKNRKYRRCVTFLFRIDLTSPRVLYTHTYTHVHNEHRREGTERGPIIIIIKSHWRRTPPSSKYKLHVVDRVPPSGWPTPRLKKTTHTHTPIYRALQRSDIILCTRYCITVIGINKKKCIFDEKRKAAGEGRVSVGWKSGGRRGGEPCGTCLHAHAHIHAFFGRRADEGEGEFSRSTWPSRRCYLRASTQEPRSGNHGHGGNDDETAVAAVRPPPYRVARCEREDNEGHSTNTVCAVCLATPALYPFTESSLPPPTPHPRGTHDQHTSTPGRPPDQHELRIPPPHATKTFVEYRSARTTHGETGERMKVTPCKSDVKTKQILRDRATRKRRFPTTCRVENMIFFFF